MKKVFIISCKDYNFYNFRRELIVEIMEKYDVTLVSPYGSKIDYFTEKGAHFVEINLDRRGTNPFNDLKLIHDYSKLLKKEKPDLVLTFTGKSSIYGGIACAKNNIPCIINNAGLIETDKTLLSLILDCLYKVGFKKASCMMYQNSREASYLNKILKNKVKYRLLPGSGVNLEYFSFAEYPKENDKIIFNFVGRLVSIKGIDEYLRCAEIIKEKHKNVEFRIFGDYDEEIYKQRVTDLQDKGVVKYMGIQVDMRPFIKEACAVIHPSYYEGMTNVVLEHSAMGRICIGSNIPGVKEGIDEGHTGFLFETKNVASMVEAVEKFLSLTYEEKVEFAKAARAKMENEFNRDIVTQVYFEEINRVLGEENEWLC